MSNMNEINELNIETSETIGVDLLNALVQEIKLLKKPWEKLSQNQQDDLIDRLRDRIGTNVARAVHMIAAAGRVIVQGDLEQVTIKDGVKAVVKFSPKQPNLHEMYEAQGKQVLLVVADAKQFVTGMENVTGEPDQRGIDLGHEYDPNGDGKGMPGDDDSNVVDTEAVQIEHQPLESELNQAYDDGYQAAQDGKPESDCPRMAGALCIEWVKGHKAWHYDNAANEDGAGPVE